MKEKEEIKKEVDKAKSLVAVEVYSLLDQEDEKQILREISGEIINEFVYSIDTPGREVVHLTKVGVDNLCRMATSQGEIFRIVGEPLVYDEGDYIRVIIKVGRFTFKDGKEVALDTTLGAKRQWKKMKLSNGKIVDDPFYFEKALSKAERNAKVKLLPETLIAKMIKKWKEEKRVKKLTVKEEKRNIFVFEQKKSQPFTQRRLPEMDERIKEETAEELKTDEES